MLSYSTGHTTHWGCHSTIIVFLSFLFYISRRHGFWELTFSSLFCPLSGNVTLCKRGLRPTGSKPLAVTIGSPPFHMESIFSQICSDSDILYTLHQSVGPCKFSSTHFFRSLVVILAHMELFYWKSLMYSVDHCMAFWWCDFELAVKCVQCHVHCNDCIGFCLAAPQRLYERSHIVSFCLRTWSGLVQ